MNKTIPVILAILFSSLYSCGQRTFDEKLKSLYRNTVPLIKTEELKEKSDVIILDIRSPEEFKVSHIEGAIMIDYNRFKPEDVEEIGKEKEVIVYCSVGYRSERIGEKMQKMGFTNVKNLYGGIFEWKNKGNEVVNEGVIPTDSVHTYNKAWSRWLVKGIKVYE